MNNLPENELFSAYLDGELTAAEQAEVERLLAASPAARQLLDELRALSNTLQDLPQEKLGEDLSRQVLRIAERRMLTEGEPGDLETAPTPLERSVFRRFFNRRTMVWLSLTTAIALLIVISERRGPGPAVQLAREAESSRPAGRVAGNELRTPPVLRAAEDRENKPAKVEHELLEKSPKSELSDTAAATPVAKPTQPTVPAKATVGIAGRSAGGEYQSDDRLGGDASEPVLVVRCDISHEAARKSSLDKLLVANGMARVEPTDRDSMYARAKDKMYERAKEKGVAKAKQPVEAKKPTRAPATDEYVYVEATADQIKAVLAGLKAQPDLFLAFSVKPMTGELLRDVGVLPYSYDRAQRRLSTTSRENGIQFKANDRPVANAIQNEASRFDRYAAPGAPRPAVLQYEQRPRVAGPESGSGQTGQLDVIVRQRGQQVVDGEPELGSPLEKKVQAIEQPQRQGLATSAPRQRVLFVLRLAGSDRPTTAKGVGDALKADTAKPAEPAAPAAKSGPQQ
jgi:hypothetical protein